MTFLKTLSLILLAFTSAALLAESGATYYVSKSGSNSNSGSFTAPWLTIQHAANSVSAGATVYVEAGVYNESVSFPASGTASNYITFASYPGQTAVIDGTGLSVSARKA
jgi:hypothetical protein